MTPNGSLRSGRKEEARANQEIEDPLLDKIMSTADSKVAFEKKRPHASISSASSLSTSAAAAAAANKRKFESISRDQVKIEVLINPSYIFVLSFDFSSFLIELLVFFKYIFFLSISLFSHQMIRGMHSSLSLNVRDNDFLNILLSLTYFF